MKGVLFFAGTFLRWPVQKPKEFLFLHSYLVVLYGITYFFKLFGLSISNLIFTIGIFAPLGILIYNGLPLDCLDYKSVIKRELS